MLGMLQMMSSMDDPGPLLEGLDVSTVGRPGIEFMTWVPYC